MKWLGPDSFFSAIAAQQEQKRYAPSSTSMKGGNSPRSMTSTRTRLRHFLFLATSYSLSYSTFRVSEKDLSKCYQFRIGIWSESRRSPLQCVLQTKAQCSISDILYERKEFYIVKDILSINNEMLLAFLHYYFSPGTAPWALLKPWKGVDGCLLLAWFA